MSIYRDPKIICEYLSAWLREQFRIASTKGAVLGISGGVDSALLAGLLVRALGAENIIGVIMPCHSQPIDEEYALLLADKFKFKVEKVDLSDTYDNLVSALSKCEDGLNVLPAANIKPRLRMITLYAIAQQHGYLVCGGGNKDEIMYGYFTKYGDSGVDLLPLADLLKGEVWRAAEYIGVPKEIVERAPTAGLWSGQTDETEMGLTYNELDNYIATGDAPPAAKEKIEKAMRRSEHKRKFAVTAVIPKDIK
ncbi:MAG: NAD(+) synthase [Synergistaceae bacterium]|nr:NAD(+) synthase [Synergistaceae bacterium]